MEMGGFRPEVQLRRDKLRIREDSDGNVDDSHHHFMGFSSHHLNQIHSDEGLIYESLLRNDNNPVNLRSAGEIHSADPQCFITWKSSGPEWANNHDGPVFVGESLSSSSSSVKLATNSLSERQQHYHHRHHHVGFSLEDSSVYDRQSLRGFGGSCPDSRQGGEPVKVAGNGPWNELLLLPASFSGYPRRSEDGCRRVGCNDYSATQGLSLSLSSPPSQKLCAGDGKSAGNPHRNAGPLGPFTGYAAVLRSSKFCKPAQQILEDLCGGASPENGSKFAEEVRVWSDEFIVAESSSGASVQHSGDLTKLRPETLQATANLLFLQDEVSKKYKQFRQQIEMVVSSFETVAGLSSATPHVSAAIKTVGKHFCRLRNSIADHAKSFGQLEEKNLCPKGGGGDSVSRFFDHGFQISEGSTTNLDGHQVWRPQRGLPERAVAILRAWLFDHFLHPYPTDTDKHMLASQTGLTRNQVSNWFINARVRIWKPMVEEIHTLETKASEKELPPPKNSAVHQQDCRNNNAGDFWGEGNDGARMEYRAAAAAAGPAGSVTLTLGLRQSVVGNGQRAAPSPPILPEDHQFRHQFIRDFVG